MTMRRRGTLAWTLVLAGIALIPHRAAAQRIVLSPAIGLYVPTAELYKAAISGDSADLSKQQVSIGLGGRLGILGKRIGLAVTGEYAPSKLRFDLTGQRSTEDANIFTGSARLTVFLIPSTSPIWLAVSGGAGMIRRSGAAYASLEKKTSVAPTAGAQVGFRLGQLIALTLTAEGYSYKPDFSSGGGPNDSQITQKDVHLSFGVAIPFLGLGR